MSKIVERLRCGVIGDSVSICQTMIEAADMLDFFFGQMQMCSPKMDGQHSYVFRSSGWPMTHCKGPHSEDAILAAMAEVKRSRTEALPELSDLDGLCKDSPIDIAAGWEAADEETESK
jgi:hypothetical protein